jgi:hypothetical protein
MNAFIRLLYALLLALTVVAFVGVGIFSFYQPPKQPQYPDVSASATEAQSDAANDAYNRDQDAYNKHNKTYQRTVAITLLVITVPVVLAGLYIFKRSGVIGEGLALGGIGTTIYAIIAASIADARILRFIAVSALLIGVLLVSYFRFAKEK